MTEKRYSVWKSEEKAQREGPDYKTWREAEDERENLRRSLLQRNWRIWRHNDDGTVTDVTDGEPEERWWYCAWGKNHGFRTFECGSGSSNTDVKWREGRLVYAAAFTQSTTKPTPEQFQAHVLAETGVKVPCVPEKEQWWAWNGYYGTWKESETGYPQLSRSINWDLKRTDYHCSVYGTVSNRDEKRDALLAAARAAGKPEDES